MSPNSVTDVGIDTTAVGIDTTVRKKSPRPLWDASCAGQGAVR